MLFAVEYTIINRSDPRETVPSSAWARLCAKKPECATSLATFSLLSFFAAGPIFCLFDASSPRACFCAYRVLCYWCLFPWRWCWFWGEDRFKLACATTAFGWVCATSIPRPVPGSLVRLRFGWLRLIDRVWVGCCDWQSICYSWARIFHTIAPARSSLRIFMPLRVSSAFWWKRYHPIMRNHRRAAE
jgi:hypothetical protein